MAKNKKQSPKPKKDSSPGKSQKTGKKERDELTESDLERVSGGNLTSGNVPTAPLAGYLK